MQVIFVGGILPDEELKYSQTPFYPFAADKHQKAILASLLENIPATKIRMLNIPYTKSYPRYSNHLIFRGRKWRFNNVEVRDLTLVNLPLLRLVNKMLVLILALSIILKHRNKNRIVVSYALHTPLIFPVWLFKKFGFKFHWQAIIPDLPEYMNGHTHRSLPLRILKGVDTLLLKSMIRRVDSSILISKWMMEKLSFRSQRIEVIETIVREYPQSSNAGAMDMKPETPYILYTGTLSESYGIKDLLDAFSLLSDLAIELWLVGNTDGWEKAYTWSSSVKWLGVMSNDAVMRLQKHAKLLVNPRRNTQEFTRYSFPSKTSEYMISGRPVLMHRLDGVPDEYYQYIYTFSDVSVQGIADRIREILDVDETELKRLGLEAREFILSQKNTLRQGHRIKNLFSNET